MPISVRDMKVSVRIPTPPAGKREGYPLRADCERSHAQCQLLSAGPRSILELGGGHGWRGSLRSGRVKCSGLFGGRQGTGWRRFPVEQAGLGDLLGSHTGRGALAAIHSARKPPLGAMRALVLRAPKSQLVLEDRPAPRPGPGEVLLRVRACAVCRTDLHMVDGELPDAEAAARARAPDRRRGPRGGTRGRRRAAVRGGRARWRALARLDPRACARLRPRGRGEPCDRARFTGYQIDGGYAELAVADARFCFPIPDGFPDLSAAPLLCAGLIGYRTLRLAGTRSGLASTGPAPPPTSWRRSPVFEGRRVFGFVRAGTTRGARSRVDGGRVGGPSRRRPRSSTALIFAPAGGACRPRCGRYARAAPWSAGGSTRATSPRSPISILWGERVLRSVANLTRRDGEEFRALAPRVPVRTEVNVYPLAAANEALDDLRNGRFPGAAVLVPT